MPMSYNEKATILFGPLGQRASQQIITEKIPDLMHSLDEGQMFGAVASYMRLHADEIEVTDTFDSVLTVYERVIGALLYTGKIAIAKHGLAKRGKEQLDALTAAFRPAPQDPKITEYRQFNSSCDATEYQLRLASDQGFREWANATK